MNGNLGLADTDRFDEDDVKTRGLAKQDGFTGFAGNPTQGSGAWTGADEDIGIVGQGLHPGLVAQDAALALFGTRVNREDGEFVAVLGYDATKGFDESTLASTRDSGNADADGLGLV